MPKSSLPPARLPVVGVVGSGTVAHADLARPLGRRLASMDVHLLTGGGGGVMEAVSRSFAEVRERSGRVIGVIPGDEHGRPLRSGYPNEWVEIVIRTHLPLTGAQGTDSRSRNHINVLSAQAIVVLPGGPGTRTEAELALRYGIPAVALTRVAAEPPDLPEGVEIATSVDEVGLFLQTNLGGKNSHGGSPGPSAGSKSPVHS